MSVTFLLRSDVRRFTSAPFCVALLMHATLLHHAFLTHAYLLHTTLFMHALFFAHTTRLMFSEAADWLGGFPTHSRRWIVYQGRLSASFTEGWYARQQGAGDTVSVHALCSIRNFE
jgi:hypothetical protein